MENIIKSILAIEERAKEIVDSSRRRREHSPDELGEKMTEMRAKYMKRVKEKLAEIERIETAAASEKIKEVEKKGTESLAAIKSVSDKHTAAWVEILFAEIIK